MTKTAPEIKLIALDMDGTLLNSAGEVPDENRAAIREAEEKGIQVVLSTGRSKLTCWEHAESLKLDSYLITVNGSEIWGPNGQLLKRKIVDVETIEWMWKIAQHHKTGFWATSCDNVWRNEMPEDLMSTEWLKFGFDIEDDAIRATVLEMLKTKDMLEISNSSMTNIEVNALGINKARGIETVCGCLGISMENVMACGDSLNDIAMIKEAGWGVAMGNAQETVKEAADAITSANDDAGVANAIRKWALKN